MVHFAVAVVIKRAAAVLAGEELGLARERLVVGVATIATFGRPVGRRTTSIQTCTKGRGVLLASRNFTGADATKPIIVGVVVIGCFGRVFINDRVAVVVDTIANVVHTGFDVCVVVVTIFVVGHRTLGSQR